MISAQIMALNTYTVFFFFFGSGKHSVHHMQFIESTHSNERYCKKKKKNMFFCGAHCSASSRESTVVTAPDQQRVQSFQSSQRCFKREAASAASGEGLLLYLNTCLRWLCRVIEGQSERGHSEPCLWQKGTVMEKTGKGNLTQSDGQ